MQHHNWVFCTGEVEGKIEFETGKVREKWNQLLNTQLYGQFERKKKPEGLKYKDDAQK